MHWRLQVSTPHLWMFIMLDYWTISFQIISDVKPHACRPASYNLILTEHRENLHFQHSVLFYYAHVVLLWIPSPHFAFVITCPTLMCRTCVSLSSLSLCIYCVFSLPSVPVRLVPLWQRSSLSLVSCAVSVVRY